MTSNEEALKALYTEIGTRIREARKRRGWSQLELAQAVNLTRSSVANLEAGRQRPPVHVALLIAHALTVPVDELLPSGSDLDKFVRVQNPAIDLDGQGAAAHEFVTSVMRRARGG